MIRIYFALLAVIAGGIASGAPAEGPASTRPNILFCLGDNFSWSHLPPYGCEAIEAPSFARVAREGVLFRHAYAPAPSCAPSRSAMLTGQDIWRLEQGANLHGELPSRFAVYPELLERSGYQVGYTGKGWSPGSLEASGRKRNPAGEKFADFKTFLEQKPADRPFFFWYGDLYSNPLGKPVVKDGVDLERFRIPPFLPDVEATRNDFYYYFQRLRRFDAAVGAMIAELERTGQLENTLIVFTADNGMDFPRSYPNLYDYGTRMFMAVRWGDRVRGGRTVEDFVNLIDLAPTFLEAAGVAVPAAMTGRSLMPVLRSPASGRIDPTRNRVFTARERHAWARLGGLGYPMRALRTDEFLYIRNFEPDRWPAGDPDFAHFTQGVYGDIDRCATKSYMYENRHDPALRSLFDLSFGKRPAEELYDLRQDPDQMRNVAGQTPYATAQRRLAADLLSHLRETGDPRALGQPAPWDDYTYHAAYRDRMK